jgi:molybdenum cofactor guanylyltransferase
MTRTFGLVLAGGEGSRLGGVRKADLRIGGARLLDRVSRVLEGRVTALLVASGQEVIGGISGVSVQDEARVPMGPLAGIRASIRYLEEISDPEDILVSAAVDTPFLPDDFVGKLRDAAAEAGAAYATCGENIYPTNSAWQFGLLRDALEGASESVGPKAILHMLGAKPVDWAAEGQNDPFANINTLADLIALQRRAFALGI